MGIKNTREIIERIESEFEESKKDLNANVGDKIIQITTGRLTSDVETEASKKLQEELKRKQ